MDVNLLRLVLSLAASALGLLIVRWSINLAVAAMPAYLDLRSILYVDRNVLLFALALSLLTCVLTGLGPALQTLRANVNAVLAQGGGVVRSGARAGQSASVFVVAQVALAVLLLAPAGLLTKDLRRLLETDLDPGRHSVVWNGENARGEKVASGVYFYILRTPEQTSIRKMVLLK